MVVVTTRNEHEITVPWKGPMWTRIDAVITPCQSPRFVKSCEMLARVLGFDPILSTDLEPRKKGNWIENQR